MEKFLFFLAMNLFYYWIVFGNGSKFLYYILNDVEKYKPATVKMTWVIANISFFIFLFFYEDSKPNPNYNFYGTFATIWHIFAKIF